MCIRDRYNKDEHLIKHGLTVEGVMRHFANLYGGNPDEWGVVGLLHDVDYELYPEEHCKKTIEILQDKGIDEEVIHAIISHGYGLVNDVKPVSYTHLDVYKRQGFRYGQREKIQCFYGTCDN